MRCRGPPAGKCLGSSFKTACCDWQHHQPINDLFAPALPGWPAVYTPAGRQLLAPVASALEMSPAEKALYLKKSQGGRSTKVPRRCKPGTAALSSNYLLFLINEHWINMCCCQRE